MCEQTRTPGHIFTPEEIAYWGQNFQRGLDNPVSWQEGDPIDRTKESVAVMCAQQDVGDNVPSANGANRNYFKRYSASYHHEWVQSLARWRDRIHQLDISAVLADMANHGTLPSESLDAAESEAT